MSHEVEAQPKDANYDESKIVPYSLPDPLVCADGSAVKTAEDWKTRRRPELLKLFESHVYGKIPGPPRNQSFEVVEQGTAFDGKAIRKQVAIHLGKKGEGPRIDVLLYLPARSSGRVPVFMGLNFGGNFATTSDPAVPVTTSWVRNDAKKGITSNKTSEANRGSTASRWPYEMVLGRGYGVATAYYGDIDPDFDDGFMNGVHPIIDGPETGERPLDAPGSIGAWAWGLSRMLDYLETDANVDAKKVAVLGHSRLGKTSLWAGAQDERFAIVISNDSGCGGAALSRRNFGETVERINTSFPHWFCDRFQNYNAREADLPVDQHELIALVAPRPVYVASAEEDRWADPQGEFLSLLHAEPVYLLLGTSGLGVRERPAVDQPVMRTMGYHIRTGEHDINSYDWEQYLSFADKHFGTK